jgi:hypothetical protein
MARSIPTTAADPILKPMTLIDAGGDEGFMSQGRRLPVAIDRDAHEPTRIWGKPD